MANSNEVLENQILREDLHFSTGYAYCLAHGWVVKILELRNVERISVNLLILIATDLMRYCWNTNRRGSRFVGMSYNRDGSQLPGLLL